MAHAATNPDTDLAAITKFLEAKETVKRSTGLISGAVGLNRISDYHRNRSNMPPARMENTKTDQKVQVGICDWC